MNKILISISAFIILSIIVIIVKKCRGKKKEMMLRAKDKLREENLNQSILNPAAQMKTDSMLSARPFEVSYDQANVSKNREKGLKQKRNDSSVMVQIVENSGMSERKYMFNAGNGICIGAKAGKNDIVITDPAADAVQCKIQSKNDKVYNLNVGKSGHLILRRKNKSAYVERAAVELKSGDSILIGETVFQVGIMKA